MTTTAPEKQVFLDRFVTVGGVEYLVKVVIWPGSENYSVSVEREPEPGHTIWRSVFLCHSNIEDCGRDALDGLRYALRSIRGDMRRCLHSWTELRAAAAAEPAGNVKGSKRSYYTKQANYWHGRALSYAPHWSLAKQIWKELTRL
jgi:hypothetical protein